MISTLAKKQHAGFGRVTSRQVSGRYLGAEKRRLQRFATAEENQSDTQKQKTAETNQPQETVNPEDLDFAAQFFGSYLQLGLWVAVLSYAGYRGYQAALVNPADAGMLLAPPGAAAFLIITFLAYRLIQKSRKENAN